MAEVAWLCLGWTTKPKDAPRSGNTIWLVDELLIGDGLMLRVHRGDGKRPAPGPELLVPGARHVFRRLGHGVLSRGGWDSWRPIPLIYLTSLATGLNAAGLQSFFESSEEERALVWVSRGCMLGLQSLYKVPSCRSSSPEPKAESMESPAMQKPGAGGAEYVKWQEFRCMLRRLPMCWRPTCQSLS